MNEETMELLHRLVEEKQYALLREQFGYSEDDFAFNWNDPLYDPTCPRQVVPDPEVIDFADLFE